MKQNSIGRLLDLIGDEWTLLIMRQALQGVRRYAEFHDKLPISHAVLTARLRHVTNAGLLSRETYQPGRFEYPPTACGRGLWPVLVTIWDWERTWVPAHAGLPPMVHTPCAATCRPVLTCRSCGAPVAARDVRGGWGPSGGWARSAPSTTTRRRAAGAPGQFPVTMALFGNRWSAALLGATFLGLRRFGEFEARLGVPPGVLADRLRTVVALGVCTQTAAGEYHLTETGRAFYPVLATALHWADRWFPALDGPALSLAHETCGTPFVPTLTCDQCKKPLTGKEITTG